MEPCTVGFLFTDQSNTAAFVSTAAHCGSEDHLRTGDEVDFPEAEITGRVAYSSIETMEAVDESSEDARYFNDFALVRIPYTASNEVHPSVYEWGGPENVSTSADRGEQVYTYGQSSTRQGALDARRGAIVEREEWHWTVYFGPPSYPGDSGSPVLTENGRALGIVTHLETFPRPEANTVLNLSRALDYMESKTDVDAEIATSSFADPPPIEGPAAP
jgi:hypothetical protein